MPILHWLNDDEARKTSSRVPYRLLEADANLSYSGSPLLSLGQAVTSENMLIQGDNLEALKALLPYYAGQVKCIYIDPPYNTQSAFEHYDDNLEHSIWLSTMYPRMELLRELLSEGGSIWVSIDDNEGHYLKVLLDEVFGRRNFISNVVWEKSDSPRMDAQYFSSRHDHLLVFAKNIDTFKLEKLVGNGEIAEHYKKTDEQGRKYYTKPLRAMGGQGDSRVARPNLYFPLDAPDGIQVVPVRRDGSDGAWRWGKEKIKAEFSRIEWVKGKKGWTPYFRIYADAESTRPAETIWKHEEVGSNRTSKNEVRNLFSDMIPFGTPKPEKLLKRVIELSTVPNDIVLDSFSGSGTTIAVSHKMGRRYIGVEIGEHAISFCVPRLKKVVDGEQGGISQEVNWQGGGGFHFYKLGEAIFNEEGQINPAVKFRALAAHVWFTETHTPLLVIASDSEAISSRKGIASGKERPRNDITPLLGIHNGTAYYLLYNGILGDTTKDGGNVLTGKVLASLPPHQGLKVIYGELTTFGSQRLTRENIIFKQVPYDIKAR